MASSSAFVFRILRGKKENHPSIEKKPSPLSRKEDPRRRPFFSLLLIAVCSQRCILMLDARVEAEKNGSGDLLESQFDKREREKKTWRKGQRLVLFFLDPDLSFSPLVHSLPLSQLNHSAVTKIKVANPVVDLDGDEMTR